MKGFEATHADFAQIYRAISPASTPSFWQKQIVGMSALLLKQRPIDLSSRLETFMIRRLRTAQVRYRSVESSVQIVDRMSSSCTPCAAEHRSRQSMQRLHYLLNPQLWTSCMISRSEYLAYLLLPMPSVYQVRWNQPVTPALFEIFSPWVSYSTAG